jgi:coenzyme F420-0:L-glutamate ligase/coenzyme F420-1:gamma-L-glutamate ligase
MRQRDEGEQGLELFRSRRSIRRFQKNPVPPALIDKILVAANWASSTHNKQSWRFAILTNPENRQDLATAMGARLGEELEVDGIAAEKIVQEVRRSFSRITDAPLLILVFMTMEDMDHYSDERRRQHEMTMAVQSTAMAGQKLLPAAHGLGLGACWMCAPLFCSEVVKQNFGLSSDWQPQGLVGVGYPDEIREKTRIPVTELILEYS